MDVATEGGEGEVKLEFTMKKLADFEKDDGYEVDGCFYETAESMIQCGFLDFCGCGCPTENLGYVLDGLALVEERMQKIPDFDFKAWRARAEKHFRSDEAQFFFWYWADKEKLTEHGSSVPGWLTDQGKQLLGLLREWKALQA